MSIARLKLRKLFSHSAKYRLNHYCKEPVLYEDDMNLPASRAFLLKVCFEPPTMAI